MTDFQRGVPSDLRARFLVASEFFIATRIVDDKELVFEDELIRQSLATENHKGVYRLYLFALLLNMPGQRLRAEYRSPAEAQNKFAREVLHDGGGWRARNLEPDGVIEPWIREHVALPGKGAARKFATNLAYFFEQCEFRENAEGYLVTSADTWGPIALRLFFDRYMLNERTADVDQLVRAASSAEIHKLLGVSSEWTSELVPGAAQLFLEGITSDLLMEEPDDRRLDSMRPTARISRLVLSLKRATRNRLQLERWYSGKCQVCGERLSGFAGRAVVDYAHIKPLGAPHDGPDEIGNMLSLCPNHHRQFDRRAIGIHPESFEIHAPLGSIPPIRRKLLQHDEHRMRRGCLRYHYDLFMQLHGRE